MFPKCAGFVLFLNRRTNLLFSGKLCLNYCAGICSFHVFYLESLTGSLSFAPAALWSSPPMQDSSCLIFICRRCLKPGQMWRSHGDTDNTHCPEAFAYPKWYLIAHLRALSLWRNAGFISNQSVFALSSMASSCKSPGWSNKVQFTWINVFFTIAIISNKTADCQIVEIIITISTTTLNIITDIYLDLIYLWNQQKKQIIYSHFTIHVVLFILHLQANTPSYLPIKVRVTGPSCISTANMGPWENIAPGPQIYI